MKREVLVPLVRRLNIVSFTAGMILYEGGFWVGVFSLYFGSPVLLGCMSAIVAGLACLALSCRLTWYECSFHGHRVCV